MAKMNANIFITKDYRKNDCLAAQKTNPIQTQFRKTEMNKKFGHTPTHRDLIVPFTKNHLFGIMFEWLEKSDGMLIPLRRDQGFRAIERNPDKSRK